MDIKTLTLFLNIAQGRVTPESASSGVWGDLQLLGKLELITAVGGEFQLLPRGVAYRNSLLNTPLPEVHWVDPRTVQNV